MLDFASSLYLGLNHPAESLKPWPRLTTGRPAVLEEGPREDRVARRLAALQGFEQAVLGPSTLHLFFDLCAALARRRAAFLIDEGSYPIARWGVQRATAMGACARTFRHHDPQALRRALGGAALAGRRPAVVVDGFCPGCGALAPVGEYLDVVREFGGIVLIDDTQAWGVLGQNPDSAMPYGHGGGGSLRFLNASPSDAVVVCSWAKALGVPIASLSGDRNLVAFFLNASLTRIHCSPPSQASLAAAEHALDLNLRWGDALRRRLALRVGRFRRRLWKKDVAPAGGLFPVQSVAVATVGDAQEIGRKLSRAGLKAVLQRRCPDGARVTFLINARHRPADIDNAAETLLGALRPKPLRRTTTSGIRDFKSAFAAS